jgi:hypothetical protein
MDIHIKPFHQWGVFKRILLFAFAVWLGIAILGITKGVGVTSAFADPNNDWSAFQNGQQQVVNTYFPRLANADPYPAAQMRSSDERANDRERLLRLNNPNKIGYVYELTQNGQVLAQYTIKGKVSSTDSQLTPTDSTYDNNYCNGGCAYSVASPGDDGSYGGEEGGQTGIFFFTTTGVLVEWNGLWEYSDAPLTLTTPPLITISANAQPSTTAGQLKRAG